MSIPEFALMVLQDKLRIILTDILLLTIFLALYCFYFEHLYNKFIDIFLGLCYTQLVEHFFQSLVNTSGMTLHIRQVIIPKFSCACVIDVHVWQYVHLRLLFVEDDS